MNRGLFLTKITGFSWFNWQKSTVLENLFCYKSSLFLVIYFGEKLKYFVRVYPSVEKKIIKYCLNPSLTKTFFFKCFAKKLNKKILQYMFAFV